MCLVCEITDNSLKKAILRISFDLCSHDCYFLAGMLLEIDNSELLHMLESRESLKAKVEEAVAVLQAHQAKEAAAAAAGEKK